MAAHQNDDIPAAEARERISEVISRVSFGGERLVISRNGKPQVAVVSLSDLERLEALEPEINAKRKRALDTLARIQAASAKNGVSELTDAEIDEEIAEARTARKSARKRAAK